MTETQAVPILAVIMNFIMVSSLSFITFQVYKRYLERKTKATLHLTFTIGILALGMLVSFLGTFFVYFFYDWFNDQGAYTGTHPFSASAYIFVAAGNIFLLLFTFEVFAKDKMRFVIPYSVLCIIDAAFIVFHLFDNPWDNPNEGTIPWIFFTLFHAFVTLIGYGTIFYLAYRVSKKTDNLLHKRGMQMLALYPIFGLFTFIFYALDVIGPMKEWTYSPFWYLAGLCVILAAASAYIGFILPDWFRRRYEKTA